jgi:hypothetical protein
LRAKVAVATAPALLQVYRWWDGTDRARYTLEWMYQKLRLSSGQSWTARYSFKALK